MILDELVEDILRAILEAVFVLIYELFLRPLFELVINNLAYATGFILLKAASLGQLDIAPLNISDRDLAKLKKKDCGFLMCRIGKGQRRRLHAVYPTLLGFLTWVAAVVLKVVL